VAVAIVCLLSLGARAQDAGDRDAGSKIRVLENAWDQAQARGDIQALDLMFDSSMIYIDEAGSQLSKGEFLHRTAQEHRSGTLWVVSPAMSVKVYRDTAVVSGSYTGHGSTRGKTVSPDGILHRYVGAPERDLAMRGGAGDAGFALKQCGKVFRQKGEIK
jgi:hypothetical protein